MPLWRQVKTWFKFIKRKPEKSSNSSFTCPVTTKAQKRSRSEDNIMVTENMSILGKPLNRLPTDFVQGFGYVPSLVTNAAAIIEKHIKTPEIFQTQGNLTKANALLSQLNTRRRINLRSTCVHNATEALKMFLVGLPEPLLPDSVSNALVQVSQEDQAQWAEILAEFRLFKPTSFAVLSFVIHLLAKVARYSKHNNMDVRKLATVFVLDVMKPLQLEDTIDEVPRSFPTEGLQKLPYLIMVVENLISNTDVFNIKASDRVTISPTRCLFPDAAASPVPEHLEGESHQGDTPTCPHAFTGIGAKGEGGGGCGVDGSWGGGGEELYTSNPKPSSLMVDRRQEEIVTPSRSRPLAKERDISADGVTSAERVAESCKRVVSSKPDDNKEGAQDSEKHRMSITNGQSNHFGTTTVVTSAFQTKLASKGEYSLANKAAGCTKKGEKASCPIGTRRTSASTGKQLRPPKRDSDYNALTGRSRSLSKSWRGSEQVSSNKCAQHKAKKKKKFKGKRNKSASGNKKANTCSHSQVEPFKLDEEITPWYEPHTDSDDPSLMTRTIMNPRILQHTNKISVTQKLSPLDTYTNTEIKETGDEPQLAEAFILPENSPVFVSQPEQHSMREVAPLKPFVTRNIEVSSKFEQVNISYEDRKALDVSSTPSAGPARTRAGRMSDRTEESPHRQYRKRDSQDQVSLKHEVGACECARGDAPNEAAQKLSKPAKSHDIQISVRSSFPCPLLMYRERLLQKVEEDLAGEAKPMSSRLEWWADVGLMTVAVICTLLVVFIHLGGFDYLVF